MNEVNKPLLIEKNFTKKWILLVVKLGEVFPGESQCEPRDILNA